MLCISYVPQRMDADLTYYVDGDVITATMDGQTDTWDFTNMPDGEAMEITSTLVPCPVLAAKRVDGVLHVTLLRAIPARPQLKDFIHEPPSPVPDPDGYDDVGEYEHALALWEQEKATWEKRQQQASKQVYEQALDVWKRLWTDDLEVVIGE